MAEFLSLSRANGEPDAVADAVVAGKSAEGLLDRYAGGPRQASCPGGSAVQRMDGQTARAQHQFDMEQALAVGAAKATADFQLTPLTGSDTDIWFREKASANGLLDALDTWQLKYNNSVPLAHGYLTAAGRLAVLDRAGLDHRSPELYEAEFGRDGLATLARTDADTAGAVESVTSVPTTPAAALKGLRQAQAQFTAMHAQLQKHRAQLERAALQAEKGEHAAELAKINDRIAKIVKVMVTVKDIGTKVAAAYATAGTSLVAPTFIPTRLLPSAPSRTSRY